MLVGVATVATAWFLSPMILAWLAPTLAGLFLAVPLSKMSGSAEAGATLRRLGLLVTPEERNPHPILTAHSLALAERPHLPVGGVVALATDPSVRDVHYRWANPAPRKRGAPDASYLTALQKISEAETLDEALSWLDPRERMHVAGQPMLMEALMRLRPAGARDPAPPRVGVA
jgi:membrane glycosyltransferase